MRHLVLPITVFTSLSAASAQVAPSLLETKANFMTSSFCRQKASCASAGVLSLGNGRTEEYFSVKPRAKQAFGLPSYIVFVTREANRVISRVGVRYPPAQNDVEDGTFARSFFEFASGVPLRTVDFQRVVQEQCTVRIRGASQFQVLDVETSLPMDNAREQLLLLVTDSFGDQVFASRSTRVVVQRGARGTC